MAYSRTLPLIAGLSVFGAAAGVWLGHSAIAEIDPAYFGAAPDRFHADQVPYRSPDWAQVQAHEYVQSASFDGLGTGCMGCGASGDVVYAPPAVATYGDGWAEEAAAEARSIEPAAAPAAPDPEWERVARYASYAVSSEEAARVAQAQEAARAAAEGEPRPAADSYASAEFATD